MLLTVRRRIPIFSNQAEWVFLTITLVACHSYSSSLLNLALGNQGQELHTPVPCYPEVCCYSYPHLQDCSTTYKGVQPSRFSCQHSRLVQDTFVGYSAYLLCTITPSYRLPYYLISIVFY